MNILSKLLLVVLLSAMLEPIDLAHYGVIVSIVGLATATAGLNFFSYAAREIASAKASLWSATRCLAIVCLVGFIVSTIVIFGLSEIGVFPPQYLVLILMLVALELYGQDVSRLLVADSRQIVASTVSVVRQSAWVILLFLFVMLLKPEFVSLGSILVMWVASGLISSIILLRELRYARNRHCINNAQLCGFDWIKKGLLISGNFYIADLLLRAILLADRSLLSKYADVEAAAAYVFYTMTGSALLAIVDAAICVFRYPRMIRFANDNEQESLRRELLLFCAAVVIVATLFICAIHILLPFLLNGIDRASYLNYFSGGVYIYLAFALLSVSMPFHYYLYAQRFDRTMLLCHIISIFMFGIFVAITLQFDSIRVDFALFASFAILLISKAFCVVSHVVRRAN